MDVFKKLKILELGRVFSGPFCGMLFADLGAEVIKIERPGTGDESRAFGTFSAGGNSSYFNSLNRSKKSLELDLKNPEHKEVLIKLIKESDVLIHNWLQDSLDKLGFSYDEVKQMNPRLIYCSISGFGYNSRFRKNPSQDIVAQALSGFMSLTGESDGLPMKTGIPVVDFSTGLYAAYAIMSALYVREQTGKGQLVHTSLLETATAMTSFSSSQYLSNGVMTSRNGNRHPFICPYNVYKTSDGLVTLAVANQQMWIRFCSVLNLDNLTQDPDFSDNSLRLKNQDRLEKILVGEILQYSTNELLDKLNSAKVSCTIVNNLEQAFSSSEVLELDMVVTAGSDKDVRIVGKPFHLEMEDSSVVEIISPPKLGEHNSAFLKNKQ